jgi:NAD(P)-dependent dehydrogenase (short-subunit alcohol dehydrogenase family)
MTARRVAVVTGAGRGLGKHVAERLARRGIHVVCTDIDEGAARVTAAIVEGTGIGQDVRDPDGHRRVAEAATRQGELVAWINNAGILAVGDTWQLGDDQVRRMVEINLLGVIWGCHAAVAHMQRGAIVNIASMSALVPTPGLAIYGATKHAVLGYSMSLAGELRRAGRDITASALCPDAIAGEMTRAVAHDPAAGLLFSAGHQLTLDEVADAAVELVERPRLVRAMPAARAALIHLLRPFPSIGLPLLEQFAKLGRRRQH